MRKTLKSRLLILLLLTLSSFTFINLGVEDVHAQSFGLPERVTQSTSSDKFPSLAEDSSGRVWLVWERLDRRDANIYYKTYDGLSWSSENSVAASPSMDRNPAVARLSNGTMIIAWASNRTGNYEIFYRLTNGVNWSVERQLTEDSNWDLSPGFAVTRQGDLWIVWHRADGLVFHIYGRVLAGNGWGPELLIVQSSGSDVLANIRQMKDGRIWLVWQRISQGKFENYYKIFNGFTWGAEVQFTGDPNFDFNPDIQQSRDGTVWLFWSKELAVQGSDPNIPQFQEELFYQTSGDSGATWSPETRLTFDQDPTLPVDEILPSAIQAVDRRLWLAYASNASGEDWDVYVMKTEPIGNIHDVGWSMLTVSPTSRPRQGEVVTLSGQVKNYGDFSESFTVRVFDNSTLMRTDSLTLSPGSTVPITFQWDTSQSAPGRHLWTLSLEGVSENSINLGDNSGGWSPICLLYSADINRNGEVDIIDAATVAIAFDSTPGSSRWNPEADITKDGVVNILDMAQVGFTYGKKVC